LQTRHRSIALLLALALAAACAADRGDEILKYFRQDNWAAAYALAKEVAKDANASGRDRGIAGYAAFRAADVALAAKLAEPDATRDRHPWQSLSAGLVAQTRNDPNLAEKELLRAIADPEPANDARNVLFGLYQTQGRFAEAVPLGQRILEENPKGYPFDELIPQLRGWDAVYPEFKQPPKVSLAGEVELPLEAARPYILLSGKVGEEEVKFILDTGGSVHPSLSPKTSQALGIEKLGESAAFGFGGQEAIHVAKIGPIELGGIRIHPQPIAIIGMLDLLTSTMKIGGVLDTRWLLDRAATVDFEKKVLRVATKSPHSAGKGKHKLASGDTLVGVPFCLIGDGKITLSVTLDGEQTWAMFDTGSPLNMLSFEWLKARVKEGEYKISSSMALGVGSTAGAAKQIVSQKPMTLSLAGHEIEIRRPAGQESLDQQVSHGLGFQFGALLGMQIFRDARSFTIDGPGRMLYIVYEAEEPDSES
jgi:tetratricopeptide (TPR) repeat protein